MAEAVTEYKRTFEDELDWNLLEQLHRVVLQISRFSFVTKQVCLTVDIGVMGLLAKFTGEELDHSVFVAGLVIPLCFWFLDSVAYYYQVKLRGIMNSILNRLRERNKRPLIQGVQHLVIAEDRIEAEKTERLRDAFFNHSMWLYYMLIIADFILWSIFLGGFIG